MRKPLQFAAALGVSVCAIVVHADLPVRFTEWTRNPDGTTKQTCWSSDDEQWLILAPSNGRLLVELDLGEAAAERLERGSGTVTLSWTVGGVESTQSIPTEESNLDYYDYDYHTILVSSDDLRPATGADRAALRVDADLSGEVSYAIEAVRDLFEQWFYHWCVDEDSDGYCDPTEIEGGQFVLPHMRAAEQRQVADCLNEHHFQSGVRVQRQEGQIGGAVDWAAEIEWTAACATPDDAPELPEGGKKLKAKEMCETFWGELYGPESAFFFCDGSTVTTTETGTELTGYQIRYRLGKARGEFPGFMCPSAATLEQGSSAPSALIPPRQNRRAPFSIDRQTNVKPRP